MAIGEVLARYYQYPSMVDHAVKVGTIWELIGARGTSADKPHQGYREWADAQHNLLTWIEGRIGMTHAEFARTADSDHIGVQVRGWMMTAEAGYEQQRRLAHGRPRRPGRADRRPGH